MGHGAAVVGPAGVIGVDVVFVVAAKVDERAFGAEADIFHSSFESEGGFIVGFISPLGVGRVGGIEADHSWYIIPASAYESES